MLSEDIRKILPPMLGTEIDKLDSGQCAIEEIRLRLGKKVIVRSGGKEYELDTYIDREMLRRTVEVVSEHSLYAYENQLREGFITIRGGHRVGMTGKAVIENGTLKTLKSISSVNIRVSHQLVGCSDGIVKYIKGNFLIISPPGRGKTTLLRDIIRNIANTPGQSVGVIDERSELGATYMGEAQNNLGKRVDILDACPKREGIEMLARCMAPTYIAVDELSDKDMDVIEGAVTRGIYIGATVHGGHTQRDISKKGIDIFDTYIFINQDRKTEIYNEKFERIDILQ